nr:hypothetical protein CFP56_16705 [Quercus suber]
MVISIDKDGYDEAKETGRDHGKRKRKGSWEERISGLCLFSVTLDGHRYIGCRNSTKFTEQRRRMMHCVRHDARWLE